MSESEKVLVLGGCRSGKSRFALAYAEEKDKANREIREIREKSKVKKTERTPSPQSSPSVERGGETEGLNMRGKKRIFIATLEPGDEEMKERIKRHQKDRGEGWLTAEAPIKLVEIFEEYAQEGNVLLIDCLTLWISNLLIAGYTVEEILSEAEQLGTAVDASLCTVVMVSNEVGSGIVPDNRLGRDFRDAAGLVNQKLAQVCSKVVLVTAGIPQVIKK